MHTVDFDDQYEVVWDDCDLVIETLVGFFLDPSFVDDNWRSAELVVEDRLCERVTISAILGTPIEGDEEEGFGHFQAVNYRFSATTMEDDDFPLRNP